MKALRGIALSLSRRLCAVGLLVLLGSALSGCVVVPVRPGGWCYWHPYRCR